MRVDANEMQIVWRTSGGFVGLISDTNQLQQEAAVCILTQVFTVCSWFQQVKNYFHDLLKTPDSELVPGGEAVIQLWTATKLNLLSQTIADAAYSLFTFSTKLSHLSC